MAGNDTPDYISQAYIDQKPDWTVLVDVSRGTRWMRKRSTTYLPKNPSENDDEYERRIAASEFFNGLNRTIKGLVGMVFRRNPVMDHDVPEEFIQHWENIDNAGTHGDVFSRQVFEEGWRLGHSCIFVDYPEVEGNTSGAPLSIAEERETGIRPYWLHISPLDIINWRVEVINGQKVLTQVTIRFVEMVPDGAFGEEDVITYRVYKKVGDTVTWDRWAPDAKSNLGITDSGILTNQTSIPLSVIYTGRKIDELVSAPALLDLAYTNIAHWNVQSDHRHSLHIASVPIPIFKGRDTTEGKQEMGPNIGIDIDTDGDVFYLEHKGEALQQTRDEQKDLEQRMAIQGLAMLQRETRSAETAEAKKIDKSEQDSSLAASARSLQDALELALVFHNRYLGNETAGSITINQEFERLTMSPEDINAYSNLVASGTMSRETFFDVMVQGNSMPNGFDPVRELERLDSMTLPMPDEGDEDDDSLGE
jgi:hypothetical protein